MRGDFQGFRAGIQAAYFGDGKLLFSDLRNEANFLLLDFTAEVFEVGERFGEGAIVERLVANVKREAFLVGVGSFGEKQRL